MGSNNVLATETEAHIPGEKIAGNLLVSHAASQ
jgi:hypothetical protein